MDRILIVEDDEDINNLIRDFLLKDGYEIFQAFLEQKAFFIWTRELIYLS